MKQVNIYHSTLKELPRKTLFSKAETDYLKSQRLARIATTSSRGIPEVSPVGFEFDGNYFWVGSHSQDIFHRTKRYMNIVAGKDNVSLVVDDLASVDPWRPRGIKISGKAKVLEHEGMFGQGRYIRIPPLVSVSWGVDLSMGWRPSVKRWVK